MKTANCCKLLFTGILEWQVSPPAHPQHDYPKYAAMSSGKNLVHKIGLIRANGANDANGLIFDTNYMLITSALNGDRLSLIIAKIVGTYPGHSMD